MGLVRRVGVVRRVGLVRRVGRVRRVGVRAAPAIVRRVGGLFGDPKGKVYLRYRVGGMGGVYFFNCKFAHYKNNLYFCPPNFLLLKIL